ncbi:hypothetical protein ACOALZ_20440 [Nocardiopsis algeriensis]|uniref:hypothetical protein n=1 Tax=Nocardiopsis algeriensis TaxID=1478215 RepID=UPI003B4353CC
MTDNHVGGRNAVPGRWEMLPFPCHHGCNCELHQQTVYGSLVHPHGPEELDNGEMAALVAAGERVSDMLHSSRDRFAAGAAGVLEARREAETAIQRLERYRQSGDLRRAAHRVERLERDYAHYTEADKQPAKWWFHLLTAVVLLVLVTFDAWYFQALFSGLLGMADDDPWKYLGALVGGVLGVGMYLSGYILAGPIRDLRAYWRHRRRETQEGDSGKGSRGLPGGVWPWVVAAFPVVAVCVFCYWAAVRTATETDSSRSEYPVEVLLLFLVMALTLMGLEIVSRNPYDARYKAVSGEYGRTRAEADRLCEDAGRSVTEYERQWHALRSMRDEGLTMVRAELGRAWSRLILPARLRHGRAGWESPAVRGFTAPDTFDGGANGSGGPKATELTARDVEQLYQFFENIRQPVPGLGPLAEVVRAVPELDPAPVRARLERAEERMLHQYRRNDVPGEYA